MKSLVNGKIPIEEVEFDEDGILVEEYPFYPLIPLEFLLNEPAGVLPIVKFGVLLDRENYNNAPNSPVPLEYESIFSLYRHIYEEVSELSPLEMKFFLAVLKRNLSFEAARFEDVCLSLWGSTPSLLKFLCGGIDENGKAMKKIEKTNSGYLVVKKEIWEKILGEGGEIAYQLYKEYIEENQRPSNE